MARKPIAPVPKEDPPAHQCGNCWRFETTAEDHGSCFALPPQIMFDGEGDPIQVARPVVRADDRGCIHWTPRHGLN